MYREVCVDLNLDVRDSQWLTKLSLAGNYYSITNDYDKPARIFFSQGCEVTSQPAEGEQSQLSVMA